MILRFATRPDLDIFSNNEAERTIRPVKVQQRGSGRCWRTLTGLAEFALVESYLSTAAKWGISKLDALRDLFQTATHGSRPASNPPDKAAATGPVTSCRRGLVNSYAAGSGPKQRSARTNRALIRSRAPSGERQNGPICG